MRADSGRPAGQLRHAQNRLPRRRRSRV